MMGVDDRQVRLNDRLRRRFREPRVADGKMRPNAVLVACRSLSLAPGKKLPMGASFVIGSNPKQAVRPMVGSSSTRGRSRVAAIAPGRQTDWLISPVRQAIFSTTAAPNRGELTGPVRVDYLYCTPLRLRHQRSHPRLHIRIVRVAAKTGLLATSIPERSPIGMFSQSNGRTVLLYLQTQPQLHNQWPGIDPIYLAPGTVLARASERATAKMQVQ